MLHEEWVLEALQIMGDLARSIRQGLATEQERIDAIRRLETLCHFWLEWAAVETADEKIAVLERAEDAGVFADTDAEGSRRAAAWGARQ